MERESLKQFPTECGVKCDLRLNLTSLRSRPEPKPRVGCFTDGPPRWSWGSILLCIWFCITFLSQIMFTDPGIKFRLKYLLKSYWYY